MLHFKLDIKNGNPEGWPEVKKVGYNFAGWFLKENGETTDIEIKQDDKVERTQDHELIAKWTEHQYKVSFETDSEESSFPDKWVTYGKTYRMAFSGAELPEPLKTGYEFKGWFTQPTGGETVTADTLVTIAADHTLYARWEPLSYKITFDANGGTISFTEKDVTVGYEYGELPVATRDGYKFVRWYLDMSGGITIDATTIVTYPTTHTLYAEWKKQDVPVTGVTINQSGDQWIPLNGSLILSCTVNPSNATNQIVNWSSSNSSVASVDPTGLVRAKSIGKATITATTENGKTDTISVYVYNVYIKENKTVNTQYISSGFNSYGQYVQDLHITRIKAKTGGAKFSVGYVIDFGGHSLYKIYYNNNNYDIVNGYIADYFTKTNLQEIHYGIPSQGIESSGNVYGNIIN